MIFRSFVLFVALLFASGVADAQELGRRVALVVGNSAYVSQGALTNPGADARLISDTLRRVGFAVVSQSDVGKAAMDRALRDFSRQADGADIALVYFAGHGMEANGVNWLLPVDATLAYERDLAFEAVNLDTVLASIERAKGLRMVVLDACRNNPFARSMRRSPSSTRTVTRGLANIEVTGTLILYSARGGTEAQDGPPGGNSPFAAALARRIPEPGVDVRLMVSKVRDDVLGATGREQEPFSYGSLPGEEFVLAPQESAGSVVARGTDLMIAARRSATSRLQIRKTPMVSGAYAEVALAARQAALKADISRHVAEVAAEFARSVASTAVPYSFGDGRSYRGQWQAGRPNGFGVEKRSDGDYAGQFVDGLPGGFGVEAYTSREAMNLNHGMDSYFGEWKAGFRAGFGVSVRNKKAQYSGQWKGNDMDGAGVFHWSNGGLVEGEVSRGALHGRAIEISPGGAITFQGVHWEGMPQYTE